MFIVKYFQVFYRLETFNNKVFGEISIPISAYQSNSVTSCRRDKLVEPCLPSSHEINMEKTIVLQLFPMCYGPGPGLLGIQGKSADKYSAQAIPLVVRKIYGHTALLYSILQGNKALSDSGCTMEPEDGVHSYLSPLMAPPPACQIKDKVFIFA